MNKKIISILIILLMVFAAVSPIAANGQQENEEEVIKLGYVCKMLTHPWFIQEDWGAAKKCEELGVEYASVDANLDEEQTLAAIDNMIAREFDGIAVVTPNLGLGCVIQKKCDEAGIPWILIDSSTEEDCGGSIIPMVEMPSFDAGAMGGEALAKLGEEKGFFEKGNVVKVLAIDIPTINVIHDRTEGYKTGLLDNAPELSEDDVIIADSKDGMFEDDLRVSSAVFNAHPEATHWIILGHNDDCGIAPLQVLRENDFNMDNAIACGLGGNELSLEQFNSGNENYICVVISSDAEGAAAMQQLYDNITTGKPLEHEYVPGAIATLDNYYDFFPDGKLKF